MYIEIFNSNSLNYYRSYGEGERNPATVGLQRTVPVDETEIRLIDNKGSCTRYQPYHVHSDLESVDSIPRETDWMSRI